MKVLDEFGLKRGGADIGSFVFPSTVTTYAATCVVILAVDLKYREYSNIQGRHCTNLTLMNFMVGSITWKELLVLCSRWNEHLCLQPTPRLSALMFHRIVTS